MIFCLFWFLVNMMHGLKENIVFFIIWKILQKIVKEKSLWKVQDFSPTHNFRQLSHLSLLIFLGGDKNKKGRCSESNTREFTYTFLPFKG